MIKKYVAQSTKRAAAFDKKENKVGKERLENETHAFNEPPAVVKCSMSRTINMGNYESVRIEVGVDLPCLPTKIERAKQRAVDICDGWLNEMVDDVVDALEEKSKKKNRRG